MYFLHKNGKCSICHVFYSLGGYLYHSPALSSPNFAPFLFVCQKLRPGLSVRKSFGSERLEGRPPDPEVAKAGVGLENWLGILVRRRGWDICPLLGKL